MMHKIRTCQSVGRIEDRPPINATTKSNKTDLVHNDQNADTILLHSYDSM